MNKACEICRGACCESFTLNLSGLEDKFPDVYKWLGYHATKTNGVFEGLRFDCACSKLKNGKCSVYDDRPDVCKEFKVGSVQCLASIATYRHHQQKEILKEINTQISHE
jgi:Fe-S-cluster containining protein